MRACVPVARKNCQHCGSPFYVKRWRAEGRKYCSRGCLYAGRVPRPKKPKEIRSCVECGIEYRISYRPQRFCSRACAHTSKENRLRLASQARKASAAWLASPNPFRRCKKDANHEQIVAAFKGAGCCVMEQHNSGKGRPDLLVGLPGARFVVWVEIKNPRTKYGRSGLSPSQQAFANEWGGVRVVRNAEDVARVSGLLKRWHSVITKASLSDGYEYQDLPSSRFDRGYMT